MIIFKKIGYDEIPEALAKRVLNWSDKEIIFDDTGLTALQIQKIKEFILQEGYKEV